MLFSLTWSEVDPRTHAFDAALVRPTLEAIASAVVGDFRATGAPRERVEAELGRAIVATYGPWAHGWSWSPSEPGGGGPTRGWCCARDSVYRDDDRSALDTAARALAALADWRAFLVECDRLFARLRVETAAGCIATEVEHAANQILALVVQRTTYEDAWYETFSRVLRWYLESARLSDATIDEMIDGTIGGRFDSWVEPDPAVARATAVELGTIVAGQIGDGELRDAVADWRRVRDTPIALPGTAPAASSDGEVDAHLDYIAAHDRPRDPRRADRLVDALALCRDSAAHGLDLSFDQLAEWQGVVLGSSRPEPFRTTDAFGKRGRECYRFEPGLADVFERALVDASDPTLPVVVRAARAYLDVCFFHPFADGNARAARLALDHVLTRAGLVLRVAEPAFALARAVDDPDGLWGLAVVLARSIVQKNSGREPAALY